MKRDKDMHVKHRRELGQDAYRQGHACEAQTEIRTGCIQTRTCMLSTDGQSDRMHTYRDIHVKHRRVSDRIHTDRDMHVKHRRDQG